MIRKAAIILSLMLNVGILSAEICVSQTPYGLTINSEYGTYTVQEPVIMELLKSKPMERLKHVWQYGITCYARKKPDFTRYDHSVGVFLLLRHFNAPIEEQIAGLLHDVSHTVFSHVGDVLFKHTASAYSYQDSIHEWFLEKTGITAILSSYGLEDCCSEHAKKSMRMLEQDKPDLGADRIDYLLRGGLADGIITQQDVNTVLKDLCFEQGLWICQSIESAKIIGNISLILSEQLFSSPMNAFTYECAAQALSRALDIELISVDDVHFGTDDAIWTKLHDCKDHQIRTAISKIENYEKHFTLANEHAYTKHYNVKFFGVDPWVKVNNTIKRLSTLDYTYAYAYETIKETAKKGFCILHL
jgi:HD superfamily phosphohydrolase